MEPHHAVFLAWWKYAYRWRFQYPCVMEGGINVLAFATQSECSERFYSFWTLVCLCKTLSKVGLSRETNLFVFLLLLPAFVVVHGTLFTLGLRFLELMFNAKARSNVGIQQGRNRQRYIKQGENTNMKENTDKEEDEWAKKKGKGTERGGGGEARQNRRERTNWRERTKMMELGVVFCVFHIHLTPSFLAVNVFFWKKTFFRPLTSSASFMSKVSFFWTLLHSKK